MRLRSPVGAGRARRRGRLRPATLVVVPLVVAGLALPAFTRAASGPATAGTSATATAQGSGVEAKVNALLAKMTLDEKIGQVTMAAPSDNLADLARKGQVGSVLYATGATTINALQAAALQSRLHIPLIFSLDVIHGYQTLFPVGLGEASTWDPALVEKGRAVEASEATADGIKWTFNPMVDVSRDPRWGRVEQGDGEDPYLGAAIAAAKVRGYQGTDYSQADKMAATVKHFAAYGAPVAGREYNTVDMSDSQLRDDYLPPYEAAVKAGAATVMTSFNSLNGVPATGNHYLFTDVLRDEWGFDGAVVSDYQAVQELIPFGYAANGTQAAKEAMNAGTDIEMAVQVPSDYSTYHNHLAALVRSGAVSMSRLNEAVRDVLRLKFRAGMFDHPYTDPNRVKHAEMTPANLAAARTEAARSMVLLRNEGHALPLSPTSKSVAVVGPLADNQTDQMGPDWVVANPKDVVTVRTGIQRALGAGATVRYAQGCDATCTSTAGFGAAVTAARQSAVTVVVVGEPAAWSGEASSRSQLDLPGRQLDLVKAVAATGKPYVVVTMSGRPLTVPWLADHAPALVEAWFPGTMGGPGVADVLFGKVNPSGHLPMGFPRVVGQLPMSYDELATGRPGDPANKYTSKYLDVPNTPQFPFGYGLSYTSFAIGAVQLSSSSMASHGTLTVRAKVTNTGTVAGDDVVQLYLHDQVASLVQPVRKLRGFTRVSLKPGASTTVTFTVGRDDVGFWDNDRHFLVEPGGFDVWVGDSSVGGSHATFSVR